MKLLLEFKPRFSQTPSLNHYVDHHLFKEQIEKERGSATPVTRHEESSGRRKWRRSHLAGCLYVFKWCGVDRPEAQALESGFHQIFLRGTISPPLKQGQKVVSHTCHYN